MAPPKRKSAKAAPQLRSRTTRSRGKAMADPAENTQMLNEQLRALGLYAAPTLGDGNCLFRALSDQLYGTPSYHSQLRQDVCNWIEAHKRRYEPFVDDERGLDVHLQCMRQQGTYGGHLELSAFAHMTKRNVKVVQPGLVYVIEWNTGGDITPQRSPSPDTVHESPAPQSANADEEKPLTRRERKRLERQLAASAPPPPPPPSDGATPTVYVAYHDWEHFSSIRNLRGPHAGMPNVQEVAVEDQEPPSPVAPPSPVRKKPVSRTASKASTKVKIKRPLKPASSATTILLTPSQVPLPLSRSVSPVPEASSSQTVLPYPVPPTPPSPSRVYRSPKRTFDESSASSESSQSIAKRHKSASRSHDALPADMRSPLSLDDGDIDTPPLTLSAPGSPSSMSSLSSISSPEATPPPPSRKEREEKPLTARQRKRLGLPKPRAASAAAKRSAGKIVIPGGRYKRGASATPAPTAAADDRVEEWQTNGTGRLDVRGFRELKI